MPKGFSISLTRDDVTPKVRKLVAKLKNPQPLMRAIGVGLVGLTKETFNNAALRPASWPAKKDGSTATLKSREATLWRSIRVQSVSPKNVIIGSDRPYAAIHQLGGKTRPMPARPYFPFHENGKLTAPGALRVKDIVEAYLQVRADT